MVFNATFNNSSAILSVLLVEETGVLRENHRPAVNPNHDHDHDHVGPINEEYRTFIEYYSIREIKSS